MHEFSQSAPGWELPCDQIEVVSEVEDTLANSLRIYLDFVMSPIGVQRNRF